MLLLDLIRRVCACVILLLWAAPNVQSQAWYYYYNPNNLPSRRPIPKQQCQMDQLKYIGFVGCYTKEGQVWMMVVMVYVFVTFLLTSCHLTHQ